MRFGLCCTAEQAPAAIAAGYDYVELPAASVFLEQRLSALEVRALHAEATNLFAISGLKLVGPERSDCDAYAHSLIPLAAAAGIRTMVVGSGPARNAPEGYPVDQAEEEFADAALAFHRVAAPLGVTIAPESLRREETNVGNRMSELVGRLGERGVAFTVDSYHLLADWEAKEGNGTPSEEFWRYEIPMMPAHIHVSNLQRKWNLANDDGMKGFARRLHELGYDGRVSLECSWGDISSEQIIALAEAQSLFSA